MKTLKQTFLVTLLAFMTSVAIGANMVETNSVQFTDKTGFGTNPPTAGSADRTAVRGGMRIYCIDTNEPSTILGTQTNGIIIDAESDIDRKLTFSRNGTNEWSWMEYRGEEGEFIYLVNEKATGRNAVGGTAGSEIIPFVASQGGRIGINRPVNIMNYHSKGIGGGTADDMDVGGVYTGPDNLKFDIRIDSIATPDTFTYRTSIDNGTTWTANLATNNCSTSATALEKGVTVTFAAATGHAITNEWQFTAFSQLPSGTLQVFPSMYTEVLTTTNWTVETPAFVDRTYDAACSSGNAFTDMFTTTNKALYLGRAVPFNSAFFSIISPAASVALVVEAWNGAVWVPLAATNGLYDFTSGFTVSDRIRWDRKLFTWTANTPPGKGSDYNLYWIRFRSSAAATAPVIQTIVPHGKYRVEVFANHMDETSVFNVDPQGNTTASAGFRGNTNDSFADQEWVTSKHLESRLTTTRNSTWWLGTNANTSVTWARRMLTSVPGDYILTNTVVAGTNVLGYWATTNTIGASTNIPLGSVFQVNVYGSASAIGITYLLDLMTASQGASNIVQTAGAVAIPTALGLTTISITTTNNFSVNSTNFWAFRLSAVRVGNSQTVRTYGGASYPSAFNLPVSQQGLNASTFGEQYPSYYLNSINISNQWTKNPYTIPFASSNNISPTNGYWQEYEPTGVSTNYLDDSLGTNSQFDFFITWESTQTSTWTGAVPVAVANNFSLTNSGRTVMWWFKSRGTNQWYGYTLNR